VLVPNHYSLCDARDVRVDGGNIWGEAMITDETFSAAGERR
jgi:hypothetical protein